MSDTKKEDTSETTNKGGSATRGHILVWGAWDSEMKLAIIEDRDAAYLIAARLNAAFQIPVLDPDGSQSFECFRIVDVLPSYGSVEETMQAVLKAVMRSFVPEPKYLESSYEDIPDNFKDRRH